MVTWFKNNVWNIVVIIIIALLVFLAIKKIINDKRQGKSTCSGACAYCNKVNNCGKRKN